MVAITIRNVPDETRNELKARASRAGQSLQEYLREELIRLAEKPDMATWLAGVRRRLAATGGATLTTEQILEYKSADRP